MTAKNAAAVCDARNVFPPEDCAGYSAINGFEVMNSRVLNLSRGCDTRCPFCFASSAPTIENMRWRHVEELGQRLDAAREHDVNFDGDALRNFHDQEFDTDFGDAAQIINFNRVATSGFAKGSVGERAAQKLAGLPKKPCVVVNFSLLSGWARELGTREYALAMGNVFDILQPAGITAFINHENYAATRAAMLAADGERFCVDYVFPHREGRAMFLPEEDTYMQEGGSVLPRPVIIFEPNGEINFALPTGNTHDKTKIRPAGKDLPRATDLREYYILMLFAPIQRAMQALLKR
jgi:hypothetical protein